jgi:hypothetical protein
MRSGVPLACGNGHGLPGVGRAEFTNQLACH